MVTHPGTDLAFWKLFSSTGLNLVIINNRIPVYIVGPVLPTKSCLRQRRRSNTKRKRKKKKAIGQ